MRIRLVLAAGCILAFPLLFSPSRSEKLSSPGAFATVAVAGHTTLGTWCECGGSFAGCICDPGEEPARQRVRPVPPESTQSKPAELGSGILLVLAALLITLRYKA